MLRKQSNATTIASKTTARALQARCGDISSSVLNDRVGELRDAGIVDAGSYGLTRKGEKLIEALGPLDAWARRRGARSA